MFGLKDWLWKKNIMTIKEGKDTTSVDRLSSKEKKSLFSRLISLKRKKKQKGHSLRKAPEEESQLLNKRK